MEIILSTMRERYLYIIYLFYFILFSLSPFFSFLFFFFSFSFLFLFFFFSFFFLFFFFSFSFLFTLSLSFSFLSFPFLLSFPHSLPHLYNKHLLSIYISIMFSTRFFAVIRQARLLKTNSLSTLQQSTSVV